ncbi:MAG: type II toxin-antitoxin system RelE/ParE family toxin [Nitrospirae bacterium]|nr:type II toxin-antitoxin system RelE/ParE family toxin [Nitrospirota bacterium]
MIILFKTAKLEKECNSQILMLKRFGAQRAKLLMRRLNELHAAASLDVLRDLPQTRCHELKGNRKGQLSVDLEHPYRLIFEPADDPIPKKKDGGLDWSKVTKVRIFGVEDTHE